MPLLLFADALHVDRAIAYRDISFYWRAQVECLVRVLGQGSWPLWNPFFGFGAPMLADASYQLAYPFTWLNLLLSPALFYKALALTHVALSGVGAFRLALRLGLERSGALVAGGLWASSGPFLSTLSMNHHFVGAAWMPWTLWALEGLVSGSTRRRLLLFAGTAALQLLGGSGDMVLMTGLAGLIRLIVLARHEGMRVALQTGARAAVGAGLAFALAAVQWFPTLDLAARSSRTEMPYAARSFWSFHPAVSTDFFVPRLMGAAPLTPAARELLFEGREPFLASLYLTVLGWPLAARGAFSRGPARATALLACAAFFATALGRHGPLYATMVGVPPFSLMRYPVKYLVPFSLFWALLAGLGVGRREALVSRPAATALRATGGLLATAALVALTLLHWAPHGPLLRAVDWAIVASEPERSTWLAAALGSLAWVAMQGALAVLTPSRWLPALGLIALADGVRGGRLATPVSPSALFDHVPPLARSVGAASRIYSAGHSRQWLTDQLAWGPAGWSGEDRWTLGLIESLRPPSAARFGIGGSYDGDFTGLLPRATSEMADLLDRHRGSPFGLRLLQIGSVDLVADLEPGPNPGLIPVGPPIRSVYRAPLRLWRVPQPLPRAFVVGRAVVKPEPDSYLRLADPGFDPRNEIVLSEGEALSDPADSVGRANVIERRPDRIELEVEATQPAYTVLVEAYDAGWRASVDGLPVPVRRANVLFSAVLVPAGRHRVVLRYAPSSVSLGLATSGISMLVAASLGWRRSP